jgi:hypothetical protein
LVATTWRAGGGPSSSRAGGSSSGRMGCSVWGVRGEEYGVRGAGCRAPGGWAAGGPARRVSGTRRGGSPRGRGWWRHPGRRSRCRAAGRRRVGGAREARGTRRRSRRCSAGLGGGSRVTDPAHLPTDLVHLRHGPSTSPSRIHSIPHPGYTHPQSLTSAHDTLFSGYTARNTHYLPVIYSAREVLRPIYTPPRKLFAQEASAGYILLWSPDKIERD